MQDVAAVGRGPGRAPSVAVLVLVLLACRGAPGAATDPGKGSLEPARPVGNLEERMSETTAVFTARDGSRSSFRLEIADTPERREQGLMHRKSMEPDRGMVFVFPADGVQTFWMKNTYIPLDMVFVEAGGRVAGVVEDARPMTLEVRTVGVPSRYVVELNARTARAKGIGPGATVVFDPPLGR